MSGYINIKPFLTRINRVQLKFNAYFSWIVSMMLFCSSLSIITNLNRLFGYDKGNLVPRLLIIGYDALVLLAVCEGPAMVEKEVRILH